MAFLLLDNYDASNNGNDADHHFDTMEGVQKYLDGEARDYADDEYSFERWSEGLTLYEVTGPAISVNVQRRVSVSIGSPMEIPAPLPGESVTDYAARITKR